MGRFHEIEASTDAVGHAEPEQRAGDEAKGQDLEPAAEADTEEERACVEGDLGAVVGLEYELLGVARLLESG